MASKEDAFNLLETEPAEALKLFEEILSKSPYDTEALFGKGKALFLLKKFESARFYLNLVATTKTPLKYDARRLLDEINIEMENLKKKTPALEIADLFERMNGEKREEEYSEMGNKWFQRGLRLAGENKFEEALKAFDNALKYEPLNKNTLNAKADVLTKLGRYSEAAKCYEQVLRISEERVVPIPAVTAVPRPKEKEVEELDALLDSVIKEVTAMHAAPVPPSPPSPPLIKIRKPVDKGLAEELAELERELEMPSPRPRRITAPVAPVTRVAAPPAPKEGARRVRFVVQPDGSIVGLLDRNYLLGSLRRHRVRKRGMFNGLLNGSGRLNGILNGSRLTGFVGDRGRLTATVNGRFVNGFVAHYYQVGSVVNGRASYKGFSNGRATLAYRRRVVRPYAEIWNTLAVFAIIGLILCVGAILYYPPYVGLKICVDGDFTDWVDIESFYSIKDEQLNPNIDIVNYSAYAEYEALSFYIKVRGTILKGSANTTSTNITDMLFVFIDSDRTYETGYKIKGIGADYLIQIKGYDNKVTDASLFIYDWNVDKKGLEWNAWYYTRKVAAVAKYGEIEIQVRIDNVGGNGSKHKMDFLVAAKSYDDDIDYTDIFTAHGGSLLVMQKATAPQVISDDEELLAVTMRAMRADIELHTITFTKVGDASAHGIVCKLFGGGEYTAPFVENKATVNFEKFILKDGETALLSVFIKLGYKTPGTTVGLRVEREAIKISNGTVSLKSDLENYIAYVGYVPTSIKIDSAFADWREIEPDLLHDVTNPNIDITHYAVRKEENKISFYLRVDGEFCGGTLIPVKNEVIQVPAPAPLPPPDTDRDTMPDEIDPYPFDFDNDGTNDTFENYDVDSDGVKDYPYGPDEWLNTTIPARETFPKDFWGKFVSVYIGPRGLLVKIEKGEDAAKIFIDADGNSTTGFVGNEYNISKESNAKVPAIWIPDGIEYAIIVKGKGNVINFKGVFEWKDGDWVERNELLVGFDSRQLELRPTFSLTLLPDAKIYFETDDWFRGRDRIEVREFGHHDEAEIDTCENEMDSIGKINEDSTNVARHGAQDDGRIDMSINLFTNYTNEEKQKQLEGDVKKEYSQNQGRQKVKKNSPSYSLNIPYMKSQIRVIDENRNILPLSSDRDTNLPWIVYSNFWTYSVANGGDYDDAWYDAVVDSSGNVYIAGFEAYGSSDNDFWVCKIDSAGTLVWSKIPAYSSNNDEGYGIVLYGGYIYAAGFSYYDATYVYDFFVVKYDSAGTEVWKKWYGGTKDEYGFDITQCGGYLYIVGTQYTDATYGYDRRIIKIDTAGSQVWGGAINTAGDQVLYGATNDGTYIYAGGYTVAGGDKDPLRVKVDSAGTEVFYYYRDNTVDDVYTNVVYGNSYLYGVGWEYVASGDYKFIIDRIKSDGLYENGVSLDAAGKEEKGMGIAIAPDNTVIACGYTNVGGNYDWLIWQLDANLNNIWYEYRGTADDDKAYGIGISADAAYTVWLVGRSKYSGQTYYNALAVKYIPEFPFHVAAPVSLGICTVLVIMRFRWKKERNLLNFRNEYQQW